MSRLKNFLQRFSLVRKLASLFRFLRDEAWFAAWVKIAPKRFMDQAHHLRSWDFESTYSQEWHGRVLAVIAEQLGGEQWGDAIEIGCSEGVFTSYLASRCRTVDGFDISPVARDRAAERCAQFANVRIGLLDLATDEIQGQYDLVFAMDILSCIRGRKLLAGAVEKLTGALKEGGILVYTDNSMPMDVLRTWGSHPWWGRFFGMVEPNECVRFMENGYPLRVVAREQYLRNPKGRNQLIALFQKGTGAGGREAAASLAADMGANVASPARTS